MRTRNLKSNYWMTIGKYELTDGSLLQVIRKGREEAKKDSYTRLLEWNNWYESREF